MPQELFPQSNYKHLHPLDVRAPRRIRGWNTYENQPHIWLDYGYQACIEWFITSYKYIVLWSTMYRTGLYMVYTTGLY